MVKCAGFRSPIWKTSKPSLTCWFLSCGLKIPRHGLFDRAAVGQSGQRNFGLVKAVFVPSGSTADAAIADYIRQLGASARNHTLVSSDRMVQAAARSRHVAILTRQEFAAKSKNSATANHRQPQQNFNFLNKNCRSGKIFSPNMGEIHRME